MQDTRTHLTSLLSAAGNGDAAAAERLWRAAHEELHRMAEARLRQEGRAQDLQPTELIQQVYVKVFGNGPPPSWTHRGQFFAAAANAMRQFLVDNARKRNRLKRGGGKSPGELGESAALFGRDPDQDLAVDEALKQLATLDPQAASVVEMRFFSGMSGDQIAEALGVSPRQVDKIWSHAKAWLMRALA